MFNSLYVVTWGNNAPIYEVDFTTEEFYTVITTDLNNLEDAINKIRDSLNF